MTHEMGKLKAEALAEVDKSDRHRSPAQLRALRADRLRVRGDAVEFPDLAGVPFPRAGVHGWQCGPAQARQQRAAVRRPDPGGVP
ncbi:hypothetical protein G6F32_016180 [Rhizopus arrhizus]|nr:hypothetical protein G6F32_016180 [Rhizopus arrhizus]